MTQSTARLSGCDGKEKLTQKRAKAAARSMRRNGRAVYPYKCRFCPHWHVASKWRAENMEPDKAQQ